MAIMPEEFKGVIALEWPDTHPGQAIPGWGLRVKDAVTGQYIDTVTQMDIHVNAQEPTWAEVWLFVDAEGEPVKPGGQVPLFGDHLSAHPKIGVFPYLISGKGLPPGGAGEDA